MIEFHIPYDDVARHPDTGREAVPLDGELHTVAYDVDTRAWWLLEGEPEAPVLSRPAWRTAPGQWRSGTLDELRGHAPLPAHHYRTLALPPPPLVSAAATCLPPRLHYIWIGERGLPDALVRNMHENAQRCGPFVGTLHVHAESTEGQHHIRRQFEGSGIIVSDLRQTASFQRFLNSPLAPHYALFLAPATRNLGAASDMLRLWLLQEWGGLYMDCDDTIASPFPDALPLAAEDDILLNGCTSGATSDFSGYNQSSWACQPGNRVLAEMLEEMQRRLQAAGASLAAPRPWRGEVMPDGKRAPNPALDRYIQQTLHCTGPGLFTDVIKRLRPDYCEIERWLLETYLQTTWTPRHPRYVLGRHMDLMHAAMAHYVPFAHEPYLIRMGNADTWNQSDVSGHAEA